MRARRLEVAVSVVALAAVTSSVRAAPSASASPASTTYVKAFANIMNDVQYDLTPEEVQATSDGGSIALALTQSTYGSGLNWLVKLDASGVPQWQRELGVFRLPPGSYTDGVSVHQTADGGYVVGGGTIGGGSNGICPTLGGLQCAYVERLDPQGNVLWARAYAAGPGGSVITRIRQAADGGYIAVGSATTLGQNTGALILKLDASGAVQWQRVLGPVGRVQVYFNAVQQTSDGGYVAIGQFSRATGGFPPTSVLVARFDASGNVRWLRGFNHLDGSGSPDAWENALSGIQTSDGGYLVAGNWTNSVIEGQCCAGALLLKLDAGGNIAWQKAYSGGVYCYFNGYNETCVDITAVVYSVHQTADGGYLLAGDGNLELLDSVPLVPWLAKVDASGNLLWQHFYYEVYPSTGRPLSEYFASSDPTPDGGAVAVGFTENADSGIGELFAVKTDGSGEVGACGEVHPATPLDPLDPGLVSFQPSLPINSTAGQTANSPSKSMATSVGTRTDC